jgi:hypothetical protein
MLFSKTRRERICENEDNNNSVMIRQKKRWITYFYSKINVFDKKTKSKKVRMTNAHVMITQRGTSRIL